MKSVFAFFLLMSTSSIAQNIDYNDVCVIVNDNSQISLEIGNYFQLTRNIPNQNIIHVFAPTSEEIDSFQFEQLRAQVEYHLISTGISDSINYLVTTKGVPLKIDSGCLFDSLSVANCASVDSELALILGPYSYSIGLSGAITNPVFNETFNFNRDSSGIYLVTRLDGYSKNDVFDLIDKSASNTGINKASAKAVVDISNFGGDSSYFVSQYLPAYNYLNNNLWNVELDLLNAPLVNQSNVFGYFGLGHGPLPNSSFNYDWTDGAVGSMSMCNSAYTFNTGINSNGDFLIADMISDGCTGILGHVDYIFFSQIWNPEIFLDRYLDTLLTYNLAESFYMAEKTLSWQTVIIGDPKASVVIDNLATINELDVEDISVYPNPSDGIVNVSSINTINSIEVYDVTGALVKNHKCQNSSSVKLDLNELVEGVYFVQVILSEKVVRKRIVISK